MLICKALHQKLFPTLLVIFNTQHFHMDLWLPLFFRILYTLFCVLQFLQLHVAELYDVNFFVIYLELSQVYLLSFLNMVWRQLNCIYMKEFEVI